MADLEGLMLVLCLEYGLKRTFSRVFRSDFGMYGLW